MHSTHSFISRYCPDEQDAVGIGEGKEVGNVKLGEGVGRIEGRGVGKGDGFKVGSGDGSGFG